MFRIGQKVVCIHADADAGRRWFEECVPVVGRIYTVATAEFTSPRTARRCIGVAELPVPPSGGYRTSRFRPIVERKTDISIFKKMLEPNTHVIAGEDTWDRQITPAMQVSWLDRQEAKMRLELSRMWKSHD